MPTSVIQQLHESEINGEVSWLFDGTFRARVGETEATLKSWAEAEQWLGERVMELYPDSVFAKGAKTITRANAARKRSPAPSLKA